MIFHLEVFLRKIRRRLSRSERSFRLLRLPGSKKTATEPGLIMIQIDGLSHAQLLKAIDKGNMPFVRRLLGKERYQLHHHYSGLPSSTPAVQGELFYGVRGAVPAFSFIDRESGEVVCMFEPGPAAKVEQRLGQKGAPLLRGGSVYSGVYTGGAAESHFCPADLGWGNLIKAARPGAFLLFIMANAFSFLRIGVLLIVEICLAIYDCITGLIDGHNLFKEVKFVPTRVAICVLLRDLITIGAKMDIARGVEIVNLNLIGYDEQAHRRGPSSLFAHWALKGIDDSIGRLWRAANRSARRSYDVWIYSDHGQAKVRSYAKEHGRPIEDAVAEIFAGLDPAAVRPRKTVKNKGIESQRVRLLGGRIIQKLLAVRPLWKTTPQPMEQTVACMGPVAMVNTPFELSDSERDQLAAELVLRAKVPLVIVCAEHRRVKAWTSGGEFVLPGDEEKILGIDHPFLPEIGHDLIEMCHHPDAGDFILSGWQLNGESYSFPHENGSHGGPGPDETGAFVLLPGDTLLPEHCRNYLRPYDLRLAACRFLGRQERRSAPRPLRETAAGRHLRVMTYNVHSCIGLDGKIAPERIARVIAQLQPDIIALQELDVGKQRTDGVDQARVIADYLRMDCHFHPTVKVEGELYGTAILTHLPMRLVRSGPLPGLISKPNLEPRGAIWVAVRLGATEIQIINTHLGLFPSERLVQVEALLGEEWLGHPDCRAPLIFCGDLNALPRSTVYRRLGERLADVQGRLGVGRTLATFSGTYPLIRLDHIFTDPDLVVQNVQVPRYELARVASDHLPLLAEVAITANRP